MPRNVQLYKQVLCNVQDGKGDNEHADAAITEYRLKRGQAQHTGHLFMPLKLLGKSCHGKGDGLGCAYIAKRFGEQRAEEEH